MSVNTDVSGSGLAAGRVYSTLILTDKDCKFYYQRSGFFPELQLPPPIKTEREDMAEKLLKVAINTIQTNKQQY